MNLNLEKLAALDRASTVVVWSCADRDDLRSRILEKLGNETASQTTIVVVDEPAKAIAHLAGRRPPIFIDARWYGEAFPELREIVEAYVEHANAMPYPPKLHSTTRFD